MVDIFWDGFDKYGPVNCAPTNSMMGSEWTVVPSSSASFVAGRFTNSLALQLGYNFAPATRTLSSNYGRLIGGLAINSNLANNNGIIFADAGTNQCAIGFNTAGKLVLWTGGFGGTQVAITSSAITASTWHYLEWDLTFSATGSYTIYLDGVSVLSGTGNLKSSSNSYANQVILNGNVCSYDDMYLFDSTGSVNNAVRGDSRVETLFPTADASVAFSPSQGVIGAYYTLSGSTSFMSANILFLRKYTAPVSGTLNSISIMPAGSSTAINFKPAVYADNSGSPGTLLSTGSVVNGATSGTAITLPLTTPQSLTAGTSYWLGYVTDTSLTMQRQDSSSFSTNSGYTASITFTSAPPSTAPSMSSGQRRMDGIGH